jgi:signal transduction histidine kinase
MHPMRMRTTLLIALFALSIGLSTLGLFIIRIHIQNQIEKQLSSDLSRSVISFQQQESQQLAMLERQSSLLANIPSLKALLTTQDDRTIADGSVDFWRLSGASFFALLRQDGRLITYSNQGTRLDHEAVANELRVFPALVQAPRVIAFGRRLYAVSAKPLFFGPASADSCLGYVAIGNAIDELLLGQLSQLADADVVFSVDSGIALSTLHRNLAAESTIGYENLFQSLLQQERVSLSGERYLVSSIDLDSAGSHSVHLTLLKSYRQESAFLDQINNWITVLGVISMVIGGMLAVTIARRITRPLEVLTAGSRALARGDFDYFIPDQGAAEIRELNRTFDSMRRELRQAQERLLESERLVTIGRMARSVSHDLRHHLSAIYANAEFLILGQNSQVDRVELMSEITMAIQDMTELLDSLIMFSQTGQTLSLKDEAIGDIVQHALQLIHPHPDARGVEIVSKIVVSASIFADAKQLSRALFNLLLNACQAARHGETSPRVEISAERYTVGGQSAIRVGVADNGPGISVSMREKMFFPFSTEGKVNGTGLGLTLALHIAQEHGGNIELASSEPGCTVFHLTLPLTPRGEERAPKGALIQEAVRDILQTRSES